MINNRGSSRSANKSDFDSHVPSTVTASEKIDKDNAIRQYATFRALMRKYDDIFNIDSEGDLEKDTIRKGTCLDLHLYFMIAYDGKI